MYLQVEPVYHLGGSQKYPFWSEELFSLRCVQWSNTVCTLFITLEIVPLDVLSYFIFNPTTKQACINTRCTNCFMFVYHCMFLCLFTCELECVCVCCSTGSEVHKPSRREIRLSHWNAMLVVWTHTPTHMLCGLCTLSAEVSPLHTNTHMFEWKSILLKDTLARREANFSCSLSGLPVCCIAIWFLQ